jgi:transcriptional regulator with XRE-family HTH domain
MSEAYAMENSRIPEDTLAEQWFGFVQHLLSEMQDIYRVRKKTHNLSQKGLAEKLGKKPSFISRCLAGQQNMTIRTIHDIARAMGCRLQITFVPLETLTPSNFIPTPKEERDLSMPPARRGGSSGNFFRIESRV